MSFSRAKISRFNDQDANISKQTTHSGNMNKTKLQKTEKWSSGGTRIAASKSSPKPRSLSQPSSNTIINKQSPRPYSGGDEKTRQLYKTKCVKPHTSDKYAEDEEDETVNMEKPSSEQIYKIDENTDDEKNSEGLDITSEPKVNNTTSKTSSSGIPLRIKQQQMSPRQPLVTTPRKASPRPTLKTNNVAFLRSIENNTVKVSQANESPKVISSAARRNLEMQYQLKKKRMDQLKKEITDRQKSLTDSYQALVQLNKKLEEAGKGYPLEELKSPGITIIHVEESKHVDEPAPPETLTPPLQSESVTEMIGGGEDVQKVQIDPNIVLNMKETIRQIPVTLLDMCKNLMNKRLAVVNILEKVSESPVQIEELQQSIQDIKEETSSLERALEEAFDEQERNVMNLVEKWQCLFMNSGDCASILDNMESLKDTIMQKDQQILQQTVEAEDIRKRQEDTIADSERVINSLKEKIKLLEQELSAEKMSIQESKDKANLFDQRMKVLKTRIKEMEGKQKETESRCIELQKAHRQAQDQLRANEHRWIKEKEELLTKHKHDRQMLDKLTKDRSYFETRVKTLEELVEEKEKKLKASEAHMKNEVEEARKQALAEKSQRESLQQKYDSVKGQLVEMEIRNKQALDLVRSKNNSEPSESANEDGITTEKETELYTELLATKVALKAAEDQIQNYNREKLRFIDSIQSLQGDPEKDEEYVAKTMIKNVEKITDLEIRLTISDETICNQKIEIANLKADIENLRQYPIANPMDIDRPTKDSDLKMMLHEGRIKLEQSLKRSLEYEHRIIRYEHDLNKQSKQICEMENLLKVRDGLIVMMKAKKDELQMENESLNKYANEIRDLLLQAKEEARNRTELVQELSTNLDCRGRACQQLEKKVKELEGSLSATNEKRFKLQESIGVMEKELQSTKAQYSRMGPDMQSRYDSDMSISQKNYTVSKGHHHHQHVHSNHKTLTKSNSTTKSKKHKKRVDSEGDNLSTVLQGNIVTGRNNEVDMWMDYYHKKLKSLKHTFRTVSNSIFVNDINLHTTAQKYATENNPRKCCNYPLTLSPSFTYFKPQITARPEILNHKKKHRGHSPVDIDSQKKKSAVLKSSVQSEVTDYKNLTETYKNPDMVIQRSSEELKKIINEDYPQQQRIDNERNCKQSVKDRIKLNEIQNSVSPTTNNFLKRTESPCILSKLRKPFSLPMSSRKQITRDKHSLHDIRRKTRPTSVRLLPNSTRTKRLSRSGSPTSRRKVRSGSESSVLMKKYRLRDIIRSNATYTEANLNKLLKTEQARFINHAHNISNHLNKRRPKQPNSNAHYIPKLLAGIRQYKVMRSAGSVVWCRPSTEMEVNSVLISHDLMAHSLNKINADVTTSINLLSKKYPKSNKYPVENHNS